MAALYYLKKLKEKGIIRKGKLEFIEKNKESKKTLIVELGESEEEQLEKYIVEIEMLVQQKEGRRQSMENNVRSAHIMNIVIFRGENMGTTKYIMSMGELYRKDNSLCFRKNGQNVYIPVENTKEIYCLNEVTVNTKLLDF